jgi:hypothetical protein
MRLNDYGRISKPAGCRQSCYDYGNGGKIESEKRAKLEEPDLQTGAGLEPSLTEPANINPIRADSVRKRTAGTLHDDSNPIHALKTIPLSEIVRQLKTLDHGYCGPIQQVS